MRQALLLLLFVSLASVATAQDTDAADATAEEPTRSPEALSILEKADQAVKAVHSVRCRISSAPTGVATNFVQAAEGTSVMVGWNGRGPEKFYANVETTDREGQPVQVTGGGNGDMYFLIDHTAKKAYEDMDPGVMGSSGRTLLGAGMLEFVHDAPFDDEIGAESVVLLEEQEVGGEPCYQIQVKYGRGNGESIWFFSKKDYLPRRRVRIFNIPEQGDGKIEINVSKLEVNIEPDEDLFRMKLPEGYEQIDDFAP